MGWIKIFLLIVLIYEITKAPITLYTGSTAGDFREQRLQEFFNRFQSPLKAKAFIEASDRYHLNWRLLPSVACAESSCGKFYRNNPLGWNSDRTYASIDDVAWGIATLPYYSAYRRSGGLYIFALSYNRLYAQQYVKELRYFYERIR